MIDYIHRESLASGDSHEPAHTGSDVSHLWRLALDCCVRRRSARENDSNAKERNALGDKLVDECNRRLLC